MKKRQYEKNSPEKFEAKRKNKNCSRAKGICKYKNFDKPEEVKKYFLIPENSLYKRIHTEANVFVQQNIQGKNKKTKKSY